MRILFIGGTGEISFECVHEAARRGHEVFVYNRGNTNEGLPETTRFLRGSFEDDAQYSSLAKHHFDVVCQFRGFRPEHVERDLAVFAGHCGQYVFISTASAYEKTRRTPRITDATPLDNPFWEYSRLKIECERLLRSQDVLPFTIVRPSHTYRRKMPSAVPGGPSRLLSGKPVIVHGDGESLWTITHARDFAPPFVKLLGESRAIGEAFHIMHEQSWTWNRIVDAMAVALKVDSYRVVHVATETLVRYWPEWLGTLWGDKSRSVQFDTTKVKSIVGDFECSIDPWQGMRLVASERMPRVDDLDPAMDALYDRISADVDRLGASAG